MNDTRALCPNCRNVVEFVRDGNYNRCPVCGSMYQLAQWRSPVDRQENSATGIGGLLGLLAKTILIMVAVVLVGMAVVFAGCALVIGGHL
jgi:hypothetical protein